MGRIDADKRPFASVANLSSVVTFCGMRNADGGRMSPKGDKGESVGETQTGASGTASIPQLLGAKRVTKVLDFSRAVVGGWVLQCKNHCHRAGEGRMQKAEWSR